MGESKKIILTISDKLYKQLEEEANAVGLTIQEYIRHSLVNQMASKTAFSVGKS